jgi:exonuclease SbcD
MKIMHLSDLHLGRKLDEFSLLMDQEYILKQVLINIDIEAPEVLIIAGDIYDKAIPSAEAVKLFDDFLTNLSKRKIKVLMINGNHDSAERIAFGSGIFCERDIYISPVFDGTIKKVEIEDDGGIVNFYLIPFLKPAYVRRYFLEAEINSYNDAMRVVVGSLNIDKKGRNVAIVHQFITGSSKSDSEDVSVGGIDNIDSDVFSDFDYTALGHLHRAQSAGAPNIRYSGTLLKYSFSEVNHEKSITMVEIDKDKNVKVSTKAVEPLRNLCCIKGTYEELTALSYYKDLNLDDYYQITLTDEDDVIEAFGRLRTIYKNLVKLNYDNVRTREHQVVNEEIEMRNSPLDYLMDFYNLQNNKDMSQEQIDFSRELMERIWEEL